MTNQHYSKSELAGADTPDKENDNLKTFDLNSARSDATGHALTTNQGLKIADNQNTLRAGSRGSALLEDFIMREKITTLTMSVFRSGLYMPVVLVHMAYFRLMKEMNGLPRRPS